ncbi:uncharacterized protein [Pyxicephalus adspersus]|uniref:uncharacterized protein isoform X4 n=1 Tax=Pyxicephalus adspersus TaxID=30357 RepID=UPI003B59FDAE
MCCFNLSDHSKSIEEEIQALQEIVQGIKQDVGSSSWWDWFLSWLPDITWLKTLFMYGIIITVCLILLCCCIHCIPSLLQALQAFCPRPRDVGHEYIEYLQMNHKRISVRTGISSLLPGAECRLLTFSFALHCSQEETHTAASIEETHRIGYQRMSYSREPTHPFQPGDMVIVQRLAKGRKQIEFPFGPPTRVVAVTRTVILTEEAQIWIHASRVKRVSEASSPASNEDKEGKAGVKSLGKEGHLEEVSLKSALPQAEDDDPTIFWEICLSVDNY